MRRVGGRNLRNTRGQTNTFAPVGKTTSYSPDRHVGGSEKSGPRIKASQKEQDTLGETVVVFYIFSSFDMSLYENPLEFP